LHSKYFCQDVKKLDGNFVIVHEFVNDNGTRWLIEVADLKWSHGVPFGAHIWIVIDNAS